MSALEFVIRYLPDPPCRVLEVGCGEVGALAYGLAAAGYEVVAIDPAAPDGPLFRRVTLEGFQDQVHFDAAVASLSLHHIDDLVSAVDKIWSLIASGGRLILEEWDRARFLEDATARWYYHQRLAQSSVAGSHRIDALPGSFEEWRRGWIEEHGHLHGQRELVQQLQRHFRELFFTWQPYLYRYSLHGGLEPLERALIEEGAIKATGFRWVGERLG